MIFIFTIQCIFFILLAWGIGLIRRDIDDLKDFINKKL